MTQFRKAGHAYDISKKEHISLNLGQLEDETPCKQFADLKFMV